MKFYIAILAAICVLSTPAMAAKETTKTETTYHDAVKKGDVVMTETVTVVTEEVMIPPPAGETVELALQNGNKLILTGRSAKLQKGDRKPFFAATGGYLTEDGHTIFVQDGAFYRTELPLERPFEAAE